MTQRFKLINLIRWISRRGKRSFYTLCPRSLDPFYIVIYKRVETSWIDSRREMRLVLICLFSGRGGGGDWMMNIKIGQDLLTYSSIKNQACLPTERVVVKTHVTQLIMPREAAQKVLCLVVSPLRPYPPRAFFWALNRRYFSLLVHFTLQCLHPPPSPS